MTDLYEALRAAMTPDGRVRLTRELLTAMHEEGERRSRMDAASEENACAAYNRGHHDGYAEADRDTLDAMGEPHDASIGVALVRYREKFAALMRERAETAERERDEAYDRGYSHGVGLADLEREQCAGWRDRAEKAERDVTQARSGEEAAVARAAAAEEAERACRRALESCGRGRADAERELEGAEREADEQRERRRRAEVERDAAHERAQKAERALAKVRDADVVDRSFYNLDRAAWSERAKRAESQLAEMCADRDSWRQQCEDARSDALRYGRERDEALARLEAFERAAEAEQAAGST